jgi:hypothetical protein
MYSLQNLLENAGSPETFAKDKSPHKTNATEYFFQILHRYLKKFGPHFRDEILRYWFTFALDNDPKELALRKQHDFLESKILTPKKWGKNQIHSIDIFQAIQKYLPNDYDDLRFSAYHKPPYPMPLVGVDVIRHVKLKPWDKFKKENPLLYVNESSLEHFIKKYSALGPGSLVVSIPTLSYRIEHARDKDY